MNYSPIYPTTPHNMFETKKIIAVILFLCIFVLSVSSSIINYGFLLHNMLTLCFYTTNYMLAIHGTINASITYYVFHKSKTDDIVITLFACIIHIINGMYISYIMLTYDLINYDIIYYCIVLTCCVGILGTLTK